MYNSKSPKLEKKDEEKEEEKEGLKNGKGKEGDFKEIGKKERVRIGEFPVVNNFSLRFHEALPEFSGFLTHYNKFPKKLSTRTSFD